MKKYTLTAKLTSKGFLLRRKNDGFSSVELLGILHLSMEEILDQLKGNIKPDIIIRQVVTNKKPGKTNKTSITSQSPSRDEGKEEG